MLFCSGKYKSYVKKVVLSRDGAWDGSLIEGVCCWGSCHVKGHCLSVCLFDCHFVELCLG